MNTINTTKTALAHKLGIARSSLYYQPKKPINDATLKTKIVAIMQEHPAYGHRRIALALNKNRKPIIRVMKRFNLAPRIRRRRRPHKPDDENKPEQSQINILKLLCPLKANMVWAGDFTYFWFVDRFWYLATAIDVYTREIVGWHIANHHTSSLIIKAFDDAKQRTKTNPTYFHSDQGSEYTGQLYLDCLKACKTISSLSTKGKPWQNGYQESFYSGFKMELGNITKHQSVGELIEAIHKQINYYNTKRIHTKLKMPPTTFYNQQLQK